jgi:cytochrome c553
VGDAPAVAGTCVACHGETGVSPAGQWPNLAGQYKSYIERSLKAYRSGERQNAIMAGIASGLSDDDIDDLADYFSAQEGPLRTAPTNN